MCLTSELSFVCFLYSLCRICGSRSVLAVQNSPLFFNVSALSSFHSFICLSLLSQKCLKVHPHCHHGNCHFCYAKTWRCLLFSHHWWLTVCACVCIDGLCASFSVSISHCVSNRCFCRIYISLLCRCLQHTVTFSDFCNKWTMPQDCTNHIIRSWSDHMVAICVDYVTDSPLLWKLFLQGRLAWR